MARIIPRLNDTAKLADDPHAWSRADKDQPGQIGTESYPGSELSSAVSENQLCRQLTESARFAVPE